MISIGALEQPGNWRIGGIGLGLALAAAPAAVLIGPMLGDGAHLGQALGATFFEAVGRSLLVATAAALVSLVVGLATGLAGSLFDFPFRRSLLAALALPLLVPSFLWAIGLSMLRTQVGLSRDGLLSGASGCVIAFMALGIPLVCYTSFAAARGISRSQLDAARLAGGDTAVLIHGARNVLPAAAVAALLAGVLTLSDPGPGQILGYSGVATQILVSFSALYDFDLAARQCLALGGVVLLLIGPAAWWGANRLSEQLLARDVEPAPPRRSVAVSIAGPALFAVVILLTAVLPLAGLIWPATRELMIGRAMQDVLRTSGNTLLYAAMASLIAVLLGIFLAICAGRDRRLQRILLTGLLVLLALPPSLSALGIAQAGSFAPEALDIVFRSHGTVGLALALRFLPIATILLLRSTSSFSSSWVSAAAIHGVGLFRYLSKVLLPMLLPAVLVAAVLVALLATAEVGIVLLVQPPGEASLPVAIFTVMANAPESLVATLCLIYVAGAATILMAAWAILLRRPAEFENEG